MLRAVVESDERDAVERVVGVGCQLPLGVGLREEVAGGVIGVDRAAGVGARLLRKVAKPINGVASNQISRIGNLRERIEAVVAVLRDADPRVGDPPKAVERVVIIRRDVVERVLHRLDVALVVVAVLGGLVLGAEFMEEAVKAVVVTCAFLHAHVRRIEYLLQRAVAHRIEPIANAVAEVVLHPSQAVRGVVAVGEIGEVRQRHFAELPYAVVVIARHLAARIARSEALTGVVAERSSHAVRVDDRQRLAVRVVDGDARNMPCRVGD